MDYEEFIKRVQEYAGLDSRDEAVKVTGAILETLGERIPRAHRQHLAAQLPGKLKAPVLKKTRPESFPLEEFYKKVGRRAEIAYHRAVKYARAVMCVLHEQVAAGELQDIFSEVTDGWRELIEVKPPGPISRYTVDAHEPFQK